MTVKTELQRNAVHALQKGKWKRALSCYITLEEGQPENADWPRRAGEILRQVKRVPEAVKAFERAVVKYERAGFEDKARALCRMILQLDPYHEAAFQRSLTEQGEGTGPQLAIGSRQDIPTQEAPVKKRAWPRADTKEERFASLLANLAPKKK